MGQSRKMTLPQSLNLQDYFSKWLYFSFLSHRASGTNVAAIDNKIEQAMVSSSYTIYQTLL